MPLFHSNMENAIPSSKSNLFKFFIMRLLRFRFVPSLMFPLLPLFACFIFHFVSFFVGSSQQSQHLMSLFSSAFLPARQSFTGRLMLYIPLSFGFLLLHAFAKSSKFLTVNIIIYALCFVVCNSPNYRTMKRDESPKFSFKWHYITSTYFVWFALCASERWNFSFSSFSALHFRSVAVVVVIFSRVSLMLLYISF